MQASMCEIFVILITAILSIHLHAFIRAAGSYEVHPRADQLPGVVQQGAEGGRGKVEGTAVKGRERTEHAEVGGQQVGVPGQQYLPQPLQTVQ